MQCCMGNPLGPNTEGLIVSYVRFFPEEYQVITHLCRSIDLSRYPPHALRRYLVGSLADTLPALAYRISQLRRAELALLHASLREPRRPEAEHDLSPEEFA